jgi:toxin FitB
MIILDTNVISELMKDEIGEPIRLWFDRQRKRDLWISAVTYQESRYGVMTLPLGRRRARLADAFDRLVNTIFDGRIAAFDTLAAEHAARIMADRRASGRLGDLRDTQIAGIALARRATLATRNTRHFDDLSLALVDPWSA